jgi:three-Cys-motif partner protein
MIPDNNQAHLSLFGFDEHDEPAEEEPVVVSMPTGPVTASDGLPARLIKPHSLEKFDRHRKYCTIFNNGMKNKWPDNRGYIELFAATGLAVVDEDRSEVDACPLLAAQAAFHRLAFVEFNPTLAAALEQRFRDRGVNADRARVFCGDANDPRVLHEALAFLPDPGLTFAFMDPEDINGHWDAIRFLGSHRTQRIDFLVNVPIGSMKRNYTSKAITAVLGTDEWEPRVKAGEPLGLVFRETLAEQFHRIGFQVAEHMEVRAFANQTPVYDLVFASRNPRAIDFWRKIQKINPYGQRQLF